MNYLFKKYSTARAIAENYAAILRYVHTSDMTPHEYTADLFANSCKVADVYDETTLNGVFKKGADATIRYSLRNYWAFKP